MSCFYVRACNVALCAACVFFFAASSFAATIVLGPSTPLSDLLEPDASMQVGDKLFTTFSYGATGDMPTADGATVTPIQDGDGHYGIRIQGGFMDLPGGNSSTALVTYEVTATDPALLISGSNMAANVALQGEGLAEVTGTFLPDFPTINLLVHDQPGNTQLTGSAQFGVPVRTLPVQTGLLLHAAGLDTGFGTMLFVDQTFSQVPDPNQGEIAEPATLGLAGLASLFFGAIYMRRRLG